MGIAEAGAFHFFLWSFSNLNPNPHLGGWGRIRIMIKITRGTQNTEMRTGKALLKLGD